MIKRPLSLDKGRIFFEKGESKMKKLVKMMMVLALMLMGIGTVVNAKDITIDPNETLVIGFDDTFAPFGFKDETGQITGFDVDLAKAVFDKMGVDYQFQAIDWSTKETELNSGNIDMIWNGYSITKEREEIVAFSKPYMDNRQVILVLKDSDIQTKADLADKQVATQAESTAENAIQQDADFMASLAGGEPITYPSFVEVFADLKNGRADAIVVDETIVAYMLEQSGDAEQYRILAEDFGKEKFAVGFRQSDQAFLADFNEALTSVMNDASYQTIQNKWFAEIAE